MRSVDGHDALRDLIGEVLLRSAESKDVPLPPDLAADATQRAQTCDFERLICTGAVTSSTTSVIRSQDRDIAGFVPIEPVVGRSRDARRLWLRSPKRHLGDLAMWIITELATAPNTVLITANSD